MPDEPGEPKRPKPSWIDRIGRTLERVEDAPRNALWRGQPVTDSAQRTLYEQGLVGQATVLKAPKHPPGDSEADAVLTFTVRVELPGRAPYDTKVMQPVGQHGWSVLRPGTLVECRVRPDNPKRVLLVPAASDATAFTLGSSGDIISRGRPAIATVMQSSPLGKTVPGTGEQFFLINLMLESEHEAQPWKVQIAQRVPNGAEMMVAPGARLTAAYLVVDQGDSVALDWSTSSGGRYS